MNKSDREIQRFYGKLFLAFLAIPLLALTFWKTAPFCSLVLVLIGICFGVVLYRYAAQRVRTISGSIRQSLPARPPERAARQQFERRIERIPTQPLPKPTATENTAPVWPGPQWPADDSSIFL